MICFKFIKYNNLIKKLLNNSSLTIKWYDQPFIELELVSQYTKVQASALQTFADVLVEIFGYYFKNLNESIDISLLTFNYLFWTKPY